MASKNNKTKMKGIVSDTPGVTRPVEPPAPELKNLHMVFKVKFSFWDHLKMLLAGRVVFVIDCLCENAPGNATTSARVVVAPFGESREVR